MPKLPYVADDADLPEFFWDRVTPACERIRLQAAEMGIDITAEEAAKFALVFLGLEEDDE